MNSINVNGLCVMDTLRSQLIFLMLVFSDLNQMRMLGKACPS